MKSIDVSTTVFKSNPYIDPKMNGTYKFLYSFIYLSFSFSFKLIQILNNNNQSSFSHSIYGGVLEFSLKDFNGTKIKFNIPSSQSGIELEFPPVPLDDPVTEEVEGIITNKTSFGMICYSSVYLYLFFFFSIFF